MVRLTKPQRKPPHPKKQRPSQMLPKRNARTQQILVRLIVRTSPSRLSKRRRKRPRTSLSRLCKRRRKRPRTSLSRLCKRRRTFLKRSRSNPPESKEAMARGFRQRRVSSRVPVRPRRLTPRSIDTSEQQLSDILGRLPSTSEVHDSHVLRQFCRYFR